MSYFGNHEKDNLLEEIMDFLEHHNISTLLEVVSYAVYRKEEEC